VVAAVQVVIAHQREPLEALRELLKALKQSTLAFPMLLPLAVVVTELLALLLQVVLAATLFSLV
jgi:hypothetical protein